MTALRVIDEYTDADAVSAIATEDAYVKNVGDTIAGNLDFSGNQAINVLLELLTSAPSTSEGRIYFDTNTKKVYIYKGA
jgi:hypothetical protein